MPASTQTTAPATFTSIASGDTGADGDTATGGNAGSAWIGTKSGPG